ncbi:MAG: CoA-acylating methylmalonate-semialdehyde dehydrogenase, partial [Acidimicrobiia bacterium]
MGITHRIDGKEFTAPTRTSPVYDPSTGVVRDEVALADAAVVDAAVEAAQRAFEEWREVPLARRVRILFAFRELLEQRKEDLARVISAEHGKVVSDALGEVARGPEVVAFACGIPHLLKGAFSESASTGTDVTSIRQPLGVVAGITPFNFPVMVPMWMYPVAIACGNAFVLKPSERDPSASLVIADLWAEAGLPPGVFNVVHGDAEAVNAILTHPGIRAVSFVGSTPIARHVYETAAVHGKRVQALGGAKNHMVVLPDADLEQAADAAVSAGFGSAGERCMAISVVVAVGSLADDLVDAIAVRTRDIRVGPSLDERSEMGPLVTGPHRDRVRAAVDGGVAAGAKLVVDGRDLQVSDHEEGFFLGPCLFDAVTPEMAVYRDEIFGPVLAVVRVDAYADAVRLLSENPYANGAAVFTRDGGAARRFAHEVDAGMIGVNVPIPVPMAYYSFGG